MFKSVDGLEFRRLEDNSVEMTRHVTAGERTVQTYRAVIHADQWDAIVEAMTIKEPEDTGGNKDLETLSPDDVETIEL